LIRPRRANREPIACSAIAVASLDPPGRPGERSLHGENGAMPRNFSKCGGFRSDDVRSERTKTNARGDPRTPPKNVHILERSRDGLIEL